MFNFNNIEFLNPWLLLLLGLIPVILWRVYAQRKNRYASYNLSSLKAFGGQSSLRGRLRVLLPILRMLALAVLIIAFARPRSTQKEEEVTADAVDIMMVMDLSSSMLARDFEPDRLEASKEVAIDFVGKRVHDRIGLTVFAGEAFTQCPLTTDHEIVKKFLAALQCGIMEDGTAIGLGLAAAVNRLKDSKAKSKVIILLTDGANNAGEYVMPMTAAEVAKQLGVKVYTIGVGTKGEAYAPVGKRANGEYIFSYSPVDLDETLLKEIAKMTKARYFRATDREKLTAIYEEIDRLEKTTIETTVIKRYSEEFFPFVLLGMFFLGLELLLRYTILRTLP